MFYKGLIIQFTLIVQWKKVRRAHDHRRVHSCPHAEAALLLVSTKKRGLSRSQSLRCPGKGNEGSGNEIGEGPIFSTCAE